MEIWKDIKGYENLYQVSNLGRVRTHENKITHTKRHGIRKWKQRILKFKGETPRTGYRVDLWKDGKHNTYLVARLVAFNFLNEDIENKELTVNHIDGNRMNNKIENLELISLTENIRHAFNTGLMPYKKVVLKKEGIEYEFASMNKASLFLGKNKGFISYVIKKGKNIVDGYEIILKEWS